MPIPFLEYNTRKSVAISRLCINHTKSEVLVTFRDSPDKIYLYLGVDIDLLVKLVTGAVAQKGKKKKAFSYGKAVAEIKKISRCRVVQTWPRTVHFSAAYGKPRPNYTAAWQALLDVRDTPLAVLVYAMGVLAKCAPSLPPDKPPTPPGAPDTPDDRSVASVTSGASKLTLASGGTRTSAASSVQTQPYGLFSSSGVVTSNTFQSLEDYDDDDDDDDYDDDDDDCGEDQAEDTTAAAAAPAGPSIQARYLLVRVQCAAAEKMRWEATQALKEKKYKEGTDFWVEAYVVLNMCFAETDGWRAEQMQLGMWDGEDDRMYAPAPAPAQAQAPAPAPAPASMRLRNGAIRAPQPPPRGFGIESGASAERDDSRRHGRGAHKPNSGSRPQEQHDHSVVDSLLAGLAVLSDDTNREKDGAIAQLRKRIESLQRQLQPNLEGRAKAMESMGAERWTSNPAPKRSFAEKRREMEEEIFEMSQAVHIIEPLRVGFE